MSEERYTCPVCFWPGLAEPSHTERGHGSYETCPCCGTQFGVHDQTVTPAELRAWWVDEGGPWKHGEAPMGWSALRQLLIAYEALEERCFLAEKRAGAAEDACAVWQYEDAARSRS
jgi:hypothetical protein